MKPCRGWTKNGKEVIGWHVKVGPKGNESHYILPIDKVCWLSSKITGLDEDCLTGLVEVIPETVGQSTGFEDKNGKEIYKGDILRNIMTTIVISWNKKRLCWDATDLKTGQSSMLSSWGIRNDFEIIGNVHDNPEWKDSDND